LIEFCSVLFYLFLIEIGRGNAFTDSVLVYNEIGILPGNLLQQYPNITSLQATGLKLTNLTSAFSKSQFFLKNLDLSNNSLAKLEPYEFVGIRNLLTLSLAYNHLIILRRHTFQGLGKLRHLNLSHNLIQVLEATIFDFLLNSIELRLNNNLLKLVNLRLCAFMKKLAKLDLSNNQIEIIINNKTTNFSSHSLEFLDLGHNHLQYIDFSSMPNFEKLTELNLQDNNLTSIGIGNLAKRFPKLKKIIINGQKMDDSTMGAVHQYFNYYGINSEPSRMNYIYWLELYVVVLVNITIGLALWLYRKFRCSKKAFGIFNPIIDLRFHISLQIPRMRRQITGHL
jgi:Leucine rich repeat